MSSSKNANSSSSSTTMKMLTTYPFMTGLSVRLVLMYILPLLLDDGVLLQGVRYTDIDYLVFTDAARYVKSGLSPFDRHTYRYTPFLAKLLSIAHMNRDGNGDFNGDFNGELKSNWWQSWIMHEKYFGKILFCTADALCGWIIVTLRRKSRSEAKCRDNNEGEGSIAIKQSDYIPIDLQDVLWWTFNPLAINICTRGSAESFVVLLSVLATVAIAMSNIKTTVKKSKSILKWTLRRNAILAGMVHGLAIHAKLYPIIYTASFMAYFSYREHGHQWTKKMDPLFKSMPIQKEMMNMNMNATTPCPNLYPFPWLNPKRLMKLIKLWIGRLLFTSCPMLFLLSSMMTFASMTYLAVLYYGNIAMEEGLLYHFSRVDHRHNYSMFFYWIYLARGKVASVATATATATATSSSLAVLGKSLVVPQLILLVYSSLAIAPTDLPFTLFVQTFLFVALNKVITAQYFTWYLVLLPLCSERIRWFSSSSSSTSKAMRNAVVLLIVSIVCWLGNAFGLEMKGKPYHLQVWIASIGFFVANVNLLRVILQHYEGASASSSSFSDSDSDNGGKQLTISTSGKMKAN